MNGNLPILYSFRRCPYAIRARLALSYAGISVELREILLKEKPKEAAKKADAEVASFASEQRKAMTKLMGLMAKDPSLGHEFLGKALSMAPETPTAETTTTESQG